MLSKTFYHSLIILAAAGATSAAYSEEELRSAALRKLVCDRVQSDFESLGALSEDCVKGNLTVVDARATVINGRKETTTMTVDAAFKDYKFKALLKRKVSVDDEGQVSLGDWAAVKVTASSIGNVAIIERSSVTSKNVKKLRGSVRLPTGVAEWAYYEDMADYDLEGKHYYGIYKDERRKDLIGYIVEEASSSTETEMRYLVTAKFTVDGNIVGEPEEESWGINE